MKLQSYWKKICDDEKRSKQRNAQLLRDLDRLETNMANLEARREKLRQLKVSFLYTGHTKYVSGYIVFAIVVFLLLSHLSVHPIMSKFCIELF